MNDMTPNRMIGMLAVAVALCAPGATLAQSPTMKTIGTPTSAAKPEIVPSLFVINSRGATMQADTLTMTGVMPHSIIFADRPVRSAGHQLTGGYHCRLGYRRRQFRQEPAERHDLCVW
jgi:hypothetical protein